MTWLEANIAAQRNGRQVPFLIRLDGGSPDHRHQFELAIKEPNALLEWLALRVQLAASGDQTRHRWALERCRAAGRITLLLDGLDHVMGDGAFVHGLANLLNSSAWVHCPLWISGRPEAFRRWGKHFFSGRRFRLLQIDPLGQSEVGYFMHWHTGHDWRSDFPRGSGELLATPRTLMLICQVLRKELPRPPKGEDVRQTKIRELELNTGAGVYHRAYFHLGKPEDQDSQGLLAQGLRADNAGVAGRTGDRPEDDFGEQVDRMGLVLGAVAFQMLPHADEIGLRVLKKEVGPKLQELGYGSEQEFWNDLKRLYRMNNHTLEFMLFNSDMSTGQLAWANGTVRAFFAAFWATRYAHPYDLALMREWIVDEKGDSRTGFDEFWQFAAEMPDRALQRGSKLSKVDLDRWLKILCPCYTPPAQLQGKHEWVQWHRRMIYLSFSRMEERSPHTIEQWRSAWLKLESGKGTRAQIAICEEMRTGFRRCPPEPSLEGHTFIMGSPNSGRPDRYPDEMFLHEVLVKPFSMHEFPVTNSQYELFDPGHALKRNMYSKADGQPVVYVTFWDAWSFAQWMGCRLPTEEEWEYACRAGTQTEHWFGNEVDLENCNCWGEKVGHTTEKGKYPANPWGLFDVHGNVLEWCDSLYQGESSARVLRGGSWYYFMAICGSACRYRSEPGLRYPQFGFRLAAVPCVVGTKQGK